MEGSDWAAGEPIVGQMDALIGQQADLQSGANEGI